jgi:hypothetical protein
MVALAVLQAFAAAFVLKEGNTPLAFVYGFYGASNLAMIWVHMAAQAVK